MIFAGMPAAIENGGSHFIITGSVLWRLRFTI
jgi:hypothetical protein